MSLASTSSEPSPEPLFDVHDLHGQAALHVAARLGQAQVVKVRISILINIKLGIYFENIFFSSLVYFSYFIINLITIN